MLRGNSYALGVERLRGRGGRADRAPNVQAIKILGKIFIHAKFSTCLRNLTRFLFLFRSGGVRKS